MLGKFYVLETGLILSRLEFHVQCTFQFSHYVDMESTTAVYIVIPGGVQFLGQFPTSKLTEWTVSVGEICSNISVYRISMVYTMFCSSSSTNGLPSILPEWPRVVICINIFDKYLNYSTHVNNSIRKTPVQWHPLVGKLHFPIQLVLE